MAVRTMAQGFDAKAWQRGDRDQPFDVTYEGAVLATFEKNGYDDSDFYAIVWDDEKGQTKVVEYATTRGWTYPNGAVVDATDEVKAKAREWARGQLFDRKLARDRFEARQLKVGRKVRAFKGRKVAVGTEGWVAALVAGAYGDRAALQVDGRLVYVAVANLEVVDAEQYFTDEAELRERADRQAANGDVTQMVASLVRTFEFDGQVVGF
jgi:hypothetical protein